MSQGNLKVRDCSEKPVRMIAAADERGKEVGKAFVTNLERQVCIRHASFLQALELSPMDDRTHQPTDAAWPLPDFVSRAFLVQYALIECFAIMTSKTAEI